VNFERNASLVTGHPVLRESNRTVICLTASSASAATPGYLFRFELGAPQGPFLFPNRVESIEMTDPSDPGDRRAPSAEAEDLVSALRARQGLRDPGPAPIIPSGRTRRSPTRRTPTNKKRPVLPLLILVVVGATAVFRLRSNPKPPPLPPLVSSVAPTPTPRPRPGYRVGSPSREDLVAGMRWAFWTWFATNLDPVLPPDRRWVRAGGLGTLPVDAGPALVYGLDIRLTQDFSRILARADPEQLELVSLEEETLFRLLLSRDNSAGALGAYLAGDRAKVREQVEKDRQRGGISPGQRLIEIWAIPLEQPPAILLRLANYVADIARAQDSLEARWTRVGLLIAARQDALAASEALALAQASGRPSWRYLAAGILHRLQHPKEEWSLVQQIIDQKETSAAAHYRLGELLLEAGRTDEATEQFRMAHRLGAGDPLLIRMSLARIAQVVGTEIELAEVTPFLNSLDAKNRRLTDIDGLHARLLLKKEKFQDSLEWLENQLILAGPAEEPIRGLLTAYLRADAKIKAGHLAAVLLALPIDFSLETRAAIQRARPSEEQQDESRTLIDSQNQVTVENF